MDNLKPKKSEFTWHCKLKTRQKRQSIGILEVLQVFEV